MGTAAMNLAGSGGFLPRLWGETLTKIREIIIELKYAIAMLAVLL